MMTEALSSYFSFEDQIRGQNLFENDAVSIGNSSDTQTQAYVKDSGAPRVNFIAESISNPNFEASCTCSAGKKGRFCKHIWATILKLESLESDFLSCRSVIEKAAPRQESAASVAAKARQAEFKQQQKEQNKARNKKMKQEKKQIFTQVTPQYPKDVEAALAYFSVNGFVLSCPVQIKELDIARKTLSRVFHPDKGGTHEEILTLNRNFDVIVDYFI